MGKTINLASKIGIFIYFLMILMAYMEKYLCTHVYKRKSLGIPAYEIFNTVFYEFFSSLWEWVPKAKETIMNHMKVKIDAIIDAP